MTEQEIKELMNQNQILKAKIRQQYQEYHEEMGRLKLKKQRLQAILLHEQSKNKRAIEEFTGKIQLLEDQISSREAPIRILPRETITRTNKTSRYRAIEERGRLLARETEKLLLECRLNRTGTLQTQSANLYNIFNNNQDYNIYDYKNDNLARGSYRRHGSTKSHKKSHSRKKKETHDELHASEISNSSSQLRTNSDDENIRLSPLRKPKEGSSKGFKSPDEKGKSFDNRTTQEIKGNDTIKILSPAKSHSNTFSETGSPDLKSKHERKDRDEEKEPSEILSHHSLNLDSPPKHDISQHEPVEERINQIVEVSLDKFRTSQFSDEEGSDTVQDKGESQKVNVKTEQDKQKSGHDFSDIDDLDPFNENSNKSNTIQDGNQRVSIIEDDHLNDKNPSVHDNDPITPRLASDNDDKKQEDRPASGFSDIILDEDHVSLIGDNLDFD